MREVHLKDPLGLNPGVKLLSTEAEVGSWGEFEPLRGTTWGGGVRVVTAEAYSHALHGYLLPLLRELGRDPKSSAKKVSSDEGDCALKGSCAIWEEGFCRPGGRNKKGEGPPGCYVPPLSKETSQDSLRLFSAVAQAWREGVYTLVVQGSGFNLK